jgi:hypothetical protein
VPRSLGFSASSRPVINLFLGSRSVQRSVKQRKLRSVASKWRLVGPPELKYGLRLQLHFLVFAFRRCHMIIKPMHLPWVLQGCGERLITGARQRVWRTPIICRIWEAICLIELFETMFYSSEQGVHAGSGSMRAGCWPILRAIARFPVVAERLGVKYPY